MRGKFSFKKNAYGGVDVLYRVRPTLWQIIFIAITALILTVYLTSRDQSYKIPLFVLFIWFIGYGSVYLSVKLWVKHFISEQIYTLKSNSKEPN